MSHRMMLDALYRLANWEYLVHGYYTKASTSLTFFGYDKLATLFHTLATEELNDAIALTDRYLYETEGLVLNIYDVTDDHDKNTICVGGTLEWVKELLEQAQYVENQTLELMKSVRALAIEEKNNVVEDMMDSYMKDEELHLQLLVKQSNMITLMGFKNYLVTQV